MRDTWAAYMVDIATGKIAWTLGGRKSSFKFGPKAGFEWQHDVQIQPNGVVSIYDDPSIATLNGVDLNGFYRNDDEGVPAQKASLVEHGIKR